MNRISTLWKRILENSFDLSPGEKAVVLSWAWFKSASTLILVFLVSELSDIEFPLLNNYRQSSLRCEGEDVKSRMTGGVGSLHKEKKMERRIKGNLILYCSWSQAHCLYLRTEEKWNKDNFWFTCPDYDSIQAIWDSQSHLKNSNGAGQTRDHMSNT